MHEHNLFSIRGGAKALYYRNKERKENIIKQNFTLTAPNEVWVCDITYFRVNDRTYYLCAILDLYARKVVAWKISQRNSTHLTKRTLKSAVIDRIPAPGLIFHSDNGTNFTSNAFTAYAKKSGIIHKQEEIYRKDYRSEKEMIRSIARYMDFYNNEHSHTVIGYQTPNKYESDYYKRKAVQKS